MSNTKMEQLSAMQKANTEVMMSLMRSTFNGMERLTALNLAATREFLNTAVANTQQMMSAKDVKDMAKINTSLSQPNLEKMLGYSRDIYDLITQMQREITQVVESRYNSFAQEANQVIDQTTSGTPVGGDVFAAAMRSMLNATNQAFDQMTTIAKQMSDMAEANVTAASNATAKAVQAASKSTTTATTTKK